jgi:hypothetical protein
MLRLKLAPEAAEPYELSRLLTFRLRSNKGRGCEPVAAATALG